MRILFWTDGFYPRVGGIETQGLELLKELQNRGHLCTVLSHKDHPDWLDDEHYQNLSIKRFDFNQMIVEQSPKNFRPLDVYLERILKEFRPDLIHLYGCFGGAIVAFLLLKYRLKIPVVLTVHAPYEHDGKITPLVRKIFSSVDRACCVSKWVLSEMQRVLPEVKDKFRLIYNGISLSKIPPAPLPFSPPTILLLGRLSIEKGFSTAIEAFSHFKKNGSKAKLLIVGGGFERPSLENLVAELKLTDSVEFTREVERDQIFSKINESTLVVAPSYFESFGLVTLEAMQMERPVIASKIGGFMETICDGVTGLLVPPKDPIAISLAIEELLYQPQKAIEMGRRGRKWAMENFTLLQNVAQYENQYKEVVG